MSNTQELKNNIQKIEQELGLMKAQLLKTETLNPNTCRGVDIYGNVKIYKMDSNGIINCCAEELVTLEVGDNVEWLECYNNKLTELTVGNNVEWLFCYNNQLTELTVGNNVEWLFCYNNQLTELTVGDNVERLSCSNNPFHSLTVPSKFKIKDLL